ncbi:MAG: acetoin dehydrogenase [Alphaproteobacteria bacterium CG11_big_fil_rev_8_21_14_0_20_44_7]|nr:MAG: acetoin dehydrogenase [Alphaproteobacteria bacterium CG11_big_fil_rev_8_21_14_0_20_44_7]
MELTENLFKQMLLIRRFEEKICEVYNTDVVKSPVHLSIGQEAVAVGVCDNLRGDDFVSNTYRCHATHIAKGGDLNKMMAELYGKSGGCAGGKAGSMHLAEFEKGILGASAVVATTIPVAAGWALTLKMQESKQVVTSFFGDGATEEGVFSETINFAALHKLPILFVCENNRLAIHNPLERRWANSDICERIKTYGIETCKIESGDVFEIHQATNEALQKIREGNAPIFMEIATYRYKQHVGIAEDLHEDYRDMAEYQKWKDNDQIDKLAKILGDEKTAQIEKDVKSQIEEAVKFAENSPFPEDEELLTHVYA